jgi:pyruvyltransferase
MTNIYLSKLRKFFALVNPDNIKLMRIIDLPLYARDWLLYRKTSEYLYWFKKNRSLNWLKGQNFGDYLSLVIVGEINRCLNLNIVKKSKKSKKRLLAVGSVLHYAQNGDVIWGSGVNGKVDPELHQFSELDVRMVRGPLTKEFLEKRGLKVDNIFGDPVLLLPTLFPELKRHPQKGKIIVLPNLNELKTCSRYDLSKFRLISPFMYWKKVVQEILSSELVLTTSLHGLVVSEAFGVPVRFVMPTGGETTFKYQDYIQGTGRTLEFQPSTFSDGINIDSGITLSEPIYEIKTILSAFPQDFFRDYSKGDS